MVKDVCTFSILVEHFLLQSLRRIRLQVIQQCHVSHVKRVRRNLEGLGICRSLSGLLSGSK